MGKSGDANGPQPTPSASERKESKIGQRLKQLRDDVADQVIEFAEGNIRNKMNEFQLGQLQQHIADDLRHHLDVCADQQRQLQARRQKDVGAIAQAFFHLDTTAEELSTNLASYAEKLQLPELKFDLTTIAAPEANGAQQEANALGKVIDADPADGDQFGFSQPGASQAKNVKTKIAPDGKAILHVGGREMPESALADLSSWLERIYRDLYHEVEGARGELLLLTSPRATEIVAVARRVRRIVPKLLDERTEFLNKARDIDGDSGLMRAVRGLFRRDQR